MRTADGEEHPADVLIYGTGFTRVGLRGADAGLRPGGVELNEEWDGDAAAYLGITVPGFPNFFMLYGPNTNLVINGSILIMVECQVRYAVEAIGRVCSRRAPDHVVPSRRARALRPRDGGGQRARWSGASPTSRPGTATRTGRVTQNWPFDLHTYWSRTREPDLADYELA